MITETTIDVLERIRITIIKRLKLAEAPKLEGLLDAADIVDHEIQKLNDAAVDSEIDALLVSIEGKYDARP